MNNHTKDQYFQDVKIENLKQKSLRSVTITLGNQALKFFLQTGSTVVMARLLTPGDFGLVAMVYSLLGFVTLVKDFGLSVATVQKQSITRDEISGLFWINVFSGLIIMGVLFILSPFISSFYQEPRAQSITMAFAVMAALSSLGAQHAAILQRQMRFETLAVRDLLAMTVGIVSGIIAAFFGMQFWALIIKEGASTAAGTLFLWINARWQPGFPRRTTGLWPMIKFGGSMTITNLLAYANHNLDIVLIGRFFGDAPAGLYSKGQGLLNQPLNQVLPPVMQVVMPLFSRLMVDLPKLKKTTLQLVEIVCFGGCLLTMLVFPVADWIVLLLLGDQWKETVPIFQVMAIFGLLEPVSYLLGTILVASGQPGAFAKWWTITMVAVLISVVAGLPWGILGVAAGYTLSGIATRTWLIFFVGKRIGIPGFKIISTGALFVVVAGLVTFSLKLLRMVWDPYNILVGLLIFFLLGSTLYVSMLFCTARGREFFKNAYGLVFDTLKGFIDR